MFLAIQTSPIHILSSVMNYLLICLLLIYTLLNIAPFLFFFLYSHKPSSYSPQRPYVFPSAIIGALTVRDRADRARQLEDYLLTAVTELFRQQLAILQSSTTTSFRRALVKLAGSTEGLQPDEEQQALRKALFDLRAAASDMEVETLGLTSAAMQAEMSSSLQALATEFPETAAAKLEEVKKIEKQTKKPAKKKGKRGINPSLNLVGMLRPPGFGNLQGFLGYSTGLLGLPLELLLGVQNDGDSPEIMGEDREHPILRLQPKVHLDIDL